MDENKLAAFYAKIKKLVTDYMAYIDSAIRKCEGLCERIEVCTAELNAVETELNDLIAEVDEQIIEMGGEV